MIVKGYSKYDEKWDDYIVEKYIIEGSSDEYLLINKIIGKLTLGEPLEFIDNETKRDLAEINQVFKKPEYIRTGEGVE